MVDAQLSYEKTHNGICFENFYAGLPAAGATIDQAIVGNPPFSHKLFSKQARHPEDESKHCFDSDTRSSCAKPPAKIKST